MTPSRLAAPEPVELVPPEEMHALILSTDAALRVLEVRAASATDAAERAEERARSLSVDDVPGVGAMVALQRFLSEWQTRADDEARAILEAARAGARVRLDDARAERDRSMARRRVAPDVSRWGLAEPPPAASTNGAAAVVAPAPAVVPGPDAPRPAPPLEDSLPTPPAAVAAAPATAAPEMAAPEMAAAVQADAVVAPVHRTVVPEPNDAVALDELAARFGPAPVDGAVPRPPVDGAAAAAVAAGPTVPLVLDANGVPMAAPPASGASGAEPFWPEQPAGKRASLLHRIPLSAVLEVIAVLLVLVFILLRLS